MSDEVRVKFLISADVWKRFQEAADERCVSTNWLANRALEDALAKESKIAELVAGAMGDSEKEVPFKGITN